MSTKHHNSAPYMIAQLQVRSQEEIYKFLRNFHMRVIHHKKK